MPSLQSSSLWHPDPGVGVGSWTGMHAQAPFASAVHSPSRLAYSGHGWPGRQIGPMMH
jgi:hypothetical protein